MCLESNVGSSNREKTKHLALEGKHQQLLNIYSTPEIVDFLVLLPFSHKNAAEREDHPHSFFSEKKPGSMSLSSLLASSPSPTWQSRYLNSARALAIMTRRLHMWY